MARFNVIQVETGRWAGTVHVIPCLKKRNKLFLRGASFLLTGVSYGEAYWYAAGFLTGKTGITYSPYVRIGHNHQTWGKLS